MSVRDRGIYVSYIEIKGNVEILAAGKVKYKLIDYSMQVLEDLEIYKKYSVHPKFISKNSIQIQFVEIM